jgi:hypothetical protein
LNLGVVERLVDTRLFDADDLAPERQDGLVAPVAALLGRAARRVALDEVQLALGRITLGAVGELAGKGVGFQRRLPLDQLGRPPRRVARLGRRKRLVQDGLADLRVSSKNSASPSPTMLFTSPSISELPSFVFVCPSNCRVRQTDGDNRNHALTHVITAEVRVLFLQEARFTRVIIDHARESRFEAR